MHDIVIFGATGFTGQHVVEALHTALAQAHSSLTVAIAGRSRARLDAVIQRVGAASFDVVIADVADEESLNSMAASARVLLNCVGPFRYWGEPVVKACIGAGTHYLDICGEPDFMERMELRYGEQARQAGCFIVSAAGFDSIPADVGTLWNASKFAEMGGTPSALESFLTMRSTAGFRVNYGTWESLVAGLAHANELRTLRKEARASGKLPPPAKPPGPRLRVSNKATYNRALSAYALPFPGADASVVKRTQAALASRGDATAAYAAYFTLSSRWQVYLMYAYGALFQQLAGFTWGRTLLLRYPGLFSNGIFSKAGPSLKQIEGASFSMTFIGHGYRGTPTTSEQAPDWEIVTRVSGPEPGYKATPIFIVQAALLLLDPLSKLDTPGVYTPGALLGADLYVKRLQAAGIKFEELSSKAI